ncbi:MAG: hypothetical protein IT342_19090 [Candidatus Melainabacteria bacterium]|nr:hypothetical protein [Candidatus Melainabacteria bacterium]
MNKKIGLLALLALTLNTAPAFAESEGTMAKQALMLPVRMAAMGSGMALGVPVAIVRRSGARSVGFTESFADNIGGKEHMIPLGMASLMGIPFGLLVGTAEGVYSGGRNSISHGWEKPFSLESFSMGEELDSH